MDLLCELTKKWIDMDKVQRQYRPGRFSKWENHLTYDTQFCLPIFKDWHQRRFLRTNQFRDFDALIDDLKTSDNIFDDNHLQTNKYFDNNTLVSDVRSKS